MAENGVNLTNSGGISGVTTSTLTLNNVLGNFTGEYSVIVSNLYGSVTSSIAILAVNDPWFSSQPASKTATVGQNISLTSTSLGTLPIRYQWRREDTEILGATNSFLTLTNLQNSQGVFYNVVASNIYGISTSSIAHLTINQAIVNQFNPGTINSEVYALALQTDGRIILGGAFSMINGKTRSGIARLNSDGT